MASVVQVRGDASLDRSDLSSDRVADAVGPVCSPDVHSFARPAIYEALEARGVLELAIEDLLFRSPGRSSPKCRSESGATRRRSDTPAGSTLEI